MTSASPNVKSSCALAGAAPISAAAATAATMRDRLNASPSDGGIRPYPALAPPPGWIPGPSGYPDDPSVSRSLSWLAVERGSALARAVHEREEVVLVVGVGVVDDAHRL